MRAGEMVGAGSLATVIPGLQGNDEADFTIQVGDGSGGGESAMFLASEFAGLGASEKEKQGSSARNRSTPFAKQLREILAECAKLGYEHPAMAFCVGIPDVSYAELFVASTPDKPADRKAWSRKEKGTAGGAQDVDRRLVLDLLKAQHQGSFDPARVAFLPMSPIKGQRRYLALVPEPGASVSTTLEVLTQQQRSQVPPARLLDTELTVYASLARRTLKPAENENTAIVRIGSEDTLILFLAGQQVRHFERLRSLTTYDPAETICSRVLLQQDEQKIGEVHHVLVLSESRPEQFEQTFASFYPHAAIAPVQSLLFKRGLQPSEEEEQGLRASSTAAAAIALRLLEGTDAADPFTTINLLPGKLRRKPKKKLAFAWHTFVMLAVLFAVSLFFTNRYLDQQAEIDQSRMELRLNPPDPTMGSPAAVQARVDSIKQVYRQYTHALQVLDSLLVGSDQWSRTLEETARATNELSGVWFNAWQPNGSYIRIDGNARSRTRVAQLANRLSGEIQSTSFQDVNDVRIYPFTMVVPRPIGMPRVAEYLRDVADGHIKSPELSPRLATDAPVQSVSDAQ